MDAFAGACRLLAEFPYAGRERTELRAGLRSWSVYPHVVFYDVDDAARIVAIERVLHGRMDIDEDEFDGDGE